MDFVVFVLLMLVANSFTVFDFTRRCLLYKNKCVPHCPRLMHPYHTRCDGQTLSQRTCYSPEISVLGFTCGWSRCDCNGNLLLDEENGLCVAWSECSRRLPRKYQRRMDKDMSGRSKRLRISAKDDEDIEAEIIHS